MPAYIETILYIFALIAIGYIAATTNYLKSEVGDALTSFIYYIGVPLLLFKNILLADFSKGNLLLIWFVYFSSLSITWFISHVTIQLVFKRDTRAGVVAGMTGAFSNCVLIGIPLIYGVFGDPGIEILSQILTIHLPFMLAATIIQFEWANRRDGLDDTAFDFTKILLKFFKQLFSNPLVLGIVCGFILKILTLEPPQIGWRLIDNIGATVGPIALFSIGMAVRKYGVSGQIPPALTLISYKLLLMPAIVLAIATLVGLPEFTTRVLITAAALPVGVNVWVIAQQFGTGQRLAATSITIGTGSALLTASLWLWICDYIYL